MNGLWHKGSVGRAVRGELHILDEQGTELPPHHTGTVYFANGGQFLYHNDPAKTARATQRQGDGRRLATSGMSTRKAISISPTGATK
jgi:hypothetical protein